MLTHPRPTNRQSLKRLPPTARFGVLLLVMLFALGPVSALAAPAPQSSVYTVQEGDTWLSIAFHFGVPVTSLWDGNGVVNPGLLAPGQRLFIPGATARQDASGSTLQIDPETSLLKVAATADTMLVTVQAINDVQWPYLFQSQVIYVPNAILHLPPPPAYLVEGGPPPVVTSAAVVPVPEPGFATHIPRDASLPPLERATLGVQGNFLVPTQGGLMDRIANNLSVGWVKQQVVWNLYEPQKGVYREAELAVLDSFVETANGKLMNVLLSVVGAPDWARPSTINHGPPTDYQDLADFMGFLAARYGGSVHAYEVWNEPNLLVEWTDFPISGTAYTNMLSVVYPAIKAANPGAIVVSAGLAPAADVILPDGTIAAVDDRTFLRDMYAAGVANYADAIGIHPYGAGNPPDASYYAGNPGGAPSHNNHQSFFFLDNVADYRVIQAENDDGRPLWATEFGWPSSENIAIDVPPLFDYMVYVSEEDQADFIFRALLIGQDWDFMGPMFVYILNIGPDRAPEDPQRGFALIDIDGRARPAYEMIRDAPRF